MAQQVKGLAAKPDELSWIQSCETGLGEIWTGEDRRRCLAAQAFILKQKQRFYEAQASLTLGAESHVEYSRQVQL